MNYAQANSSPELTTALTQSSTTPPPRPKCWLIGSGADHPRAVARIARLRALDVALCLSDGGAIPPISASRNNLIAINFDLLARLGSEAKAALRKSVENGATVYVRGGLEPERVYSLQPFSEQRFQLSIHSVGGCDFPVHPVLPAAIAGERIDAHVMRMPRALGLDGRVRPMVSGAEGPSIFTIEVGAGLVIFDLHDDDEDDDDENEIDLLAELTEPSRRAASLGALAAVDWAGGRNPATRAPVNLVIDDRPINYDYFSAAQLDALLKHLDTWYPGLHVDFAWTPRDTRPHRRYVDVLRRYNTGFVWHGFLRHVDHRTIADYEADLSEGRARVDKIWRDYGVRLQPVMIFPFEKDTVRADELLRRAGFVAKVQSAEGLVPPASYRMCDDAGDLPAVGQRFSVIFRDSIDVLSRDRMLALATLGMPIVALAHPRDLALRRIGRRNPASLSYFDSVVRFAAEKSLRPMSLEEIAAHVPAERR